MLLFSGMEAKYCLQQAEWQNVIFSPSPTRPDLLKLKPPWECHPFRLSVHRNQSFEFVASVLEPFLAYAALKADIYYMGKRYAKMDDLGNSKELESAMDINLGAEYRYSKTLSAFVQLNNILSENYYQWNYYPTYGFNFTFGVTYCF